MSKVVIDTKNVPGAIGPYSQGMIVGNLVYTSGQLPPARSCVQVAKLPKDAVVEIEAIAVLEK